MYIVCIVLHLLNVLYAWHVCVGMFFTCAYVCILCMARVYVYMCHVYVFIHTKQYVHTHIHIYTYARMYVYMYVHIEWVCFRLGRIFKRDR